MKDSMVRCLHSLICKECQVEEDGTISIISIYPRLTFSSLPATLPLCFVCFLELSLEKYYQNVQDLDVHILITSPSERIVSDTQKADVFEQISADKARLTTSVNFGEVEFLEFGTYTFQVFFKNELLCDDFFEIVQQ
jgi:hypothetical protein